MSASVSATSEEVCGGAAHLLEAGAYAVSAGIARGFACVGAPPQCLCNLLLDFCRGRLACLFTSPGACGGLELFLDPLISLVTPFIRFAPGMAVAVAPARNRFSALHGASIAATAAGRENLLASAAPGAAPAWWDMGDAMALAAGAFEAAAVAIPLPPIKKDGKVEPPGIVSRLVSAFHANGRAYHAYAGAGSNVASITSLSPNPGMAGNRIRVDVGAAAGDPPAPPMLPAGVTDAPVLQYAPPEPLLVEEEFSDATISQLWRFVRAAEAGEASIALEDVTADALPPKGDRAGTIVKDRMLALTAGPAPAGATRSIGVEMAEPLLADRMALVLARVKVEAASAGPSALAFRFESQGGEGHVLEARLERRATGEFVAVGEDAGGAIETPLPASYLGAWLDVATKFDFLGGRAGISIAAAGDVGVVVAETTVAQSEYRFRMEARATGETGRMDARVDLVEVNGLRPARYRMSWLPVLAKDAVYDDVAWPSDGRAGAAVMATCGPLAAAEAVLFDGARVALDGAAPLNLALLRDAATGARTSVYTPLSCDAARACAGASAVLDACVPQVFAAQGAGLDYLWLGANLDAATPGIGSNAVIGAGTFNASLGDPGVQGFSVDPPDATLAFAEKVGTNVMQVDACAAGGAVTFAKDAPEVDGAAVYTAQARMAVKSDCGGGAALALADGERVTTLNVDAAGTVAVGGGATTIQAATGDATASTADLHTYVVRIARFADVALFVDGQTTPALTVPYASVPLGSPPALVASADGAVVEFASFGYRAYEGDPVDLALDAALMAAATVDAVLPDGVTDHVGDKLQEAIDDLEEAREEMAEDDSCDAAKELGKAVRDLDKAIDKLDKRTCPRHPSSCADADDAAAARRDLLVARDAATFAKSFACAAAGPSCAKCP